MNLENVLCIFNGLLYFVFAVNILYLLVYSLASHRRDKDLSYTAAECKRFAIFIPAYREDTVIRECVEACLGQDYPTDRFEVIVISDRMLPETNEWLRCRPVRLVEVLFENCTKSKALNAAMAEIGNDYDIALVLDAGSIIPHDYLEDVNNSFANPDVEIVQTHRLARNLNNDMALLDAMSEEINNSIFCLGHARLGLSAALLGSGMAFEYNLFRETMANIKAMGSFDRELELTLLYQGKRFHYLPNTFVFDEKKIQNTDDFSSRQRCRWLSAQWHYCRAYVKYLSKALMAHNWDFCDKFFQQVSMPRLFLLGFTGFFAFSITIYRWKWGLFWWLLLILLCVALMVAIPPRYRAGRIALALQKLPRTFFFKLKGANKNTRHGIRG